jgi:hypothetical protein
MPDAGKERIARNGASCIIDGLEKGQTLFIAVSALN